MKKAKANRLVMWFWKNIVKKNDDKRVSAQAEPDFDDPSLDIAYIDDGHPLHTLNVYRPKGESGKLPLIVDVHGGGWYYGDKELNSYFCRSLVRYGFAVADVSYRLSPEVDIFGQIKDVCAAINHLAEHADEYGLDINSAFFVGDSAGGHIVSLLANIDKNDLLKDHFGGVELNISPKAVGLICPALEPLEVMSAPKSVMKAYFNPIFGKGYLKNGVKELISFKSVLQKNICPCFFVSSYGDMLRKQTLDGYALVKAQGTPAEIAFLDKPIDASHKLGHVFNVLYWDWKESELVNKKMCDFFLTLCKTEQ